MINKSILVAIGVGIVLYLVGKAMMSVGGMILIGTAIIAAGTILKKEIGNLI